MSQPQHRNKTHSTMRFQTDSNRKGLNLPHVSSCCEIQISWPKNIEIARHSSHWLFFQFSELQFVFLSQHFFFVHIHFHPVRTICSKSVQTRLGPKSCQELCIFWADLPPPPPRTPREPLKASKYGMVCKNSDPSPKPSYASKIEHAIKLTSLESLAGRFRW